MIVKICGITRLVDARAVISAGADALGFNFVAHSARCVDAETARSISLSIAGEVNRVAVFADPTTWQVREILDQVGVDTLQFHGNEEEDFCGQFKLPYIKYASVDQQSDWSQIHNFHANAQFLLLDSPGGGTGEVFDWNQWPENSQRQMLLAGGLTSDNVNAAIVKIQPAGVDVSGGVEGESKGIKVAEKIHKFVQEARRAQASL